METDRSGETAIYIQETKANAKGKAPLVVSSTAIAEQPKRGWKKGIAICEFFLRLCAIGAAIGATATMGTTDETLPFSTQFFQFEAQYNDIPTFEYVFLVTIFGKNKNYLPINITYLIYCLIIQVFPDSKCNSCRLSSPLLAILHNLHHSSLCNNAKTPPFHL